jgi:cobalt-zinc-cadmium resistance protein CzcA
LEKRSRGNVFLLTSGRLVSLGQVASIDRARSEHHSPRDVVRRIAVAASVRRRDLGSVVRDVQPRVTSQVRLPSNYSVNFGGQFARQQRAFDALISLRNG